MSKEGEKRLLKFFSLLRFYWILLRWTLGNKKDTNEQDAVLYFKKFGYHCVNFGSKMDQFW